MIKNWLLSGDCHGQVRQRLDAVAALWQNYEPSETALILLGDVSFNFYLNRSEQKYKHQINKRGFRIYCLRGNHEARPQDIGAELVWDEEIKGEVYIEPDYPNIKYFVDGGEYEIDGYKVLTIGGAYSVDKFYRLARGGVGWFENEQLSYNEFEEIFNRVKGKEFDFVFTHTCPLSFQPRDLFLSFIGQSTVDNTTEIFLEVLKDNISYKYWCFGHYHADRVEQPYVCQFYTDLIEIPDFIYGWKMYDESGKLPSYWNLSPSMKRILEC